MTDSSRGASISAEEHAATAEAMFKQMDTDGDGNLTAAELDAGHRKMGAGGQQGMGPGMMGQGMGPGMMDRDGDGAISAQEHADMARAMFQRMDTDGDGKVSVEAMASAHASMMRGASMRGTGRGMGVKAAGMVHGMSSAELIALMDLDGDGRISAAEYSAGTRALFEEADTDNDGHLSMAERAAHHELMMRQVDDVGHEEDGD